MRLPLRYLALRVRIWIFSSYRFTVCSGHEAVICYHENQRWQAIRNERLVDHTGRSQLHCIASPQWMALEKFSGKVNDPWLDWDDAILRGAVGAEGLDQLVSFL